MNAYAASTFYAVDRYASYRKDWGKAYAAGELILADRYTTSNAVHQGAKLPEAEREAFFRWLAEFEWQRLGLPRPQAVLYLDVPTEVTLDMLRMRQSRTGTQGDIHEKDAAYLRIWSGDRPAGRPILWLAGDFLRERRRHARSHGHP